MALPFPTRNRETARMSLIHEALQKAEAERRAGELPPLVSISTPLRRAPRERSGPPLWIGLGVAVLAAAAYVNRDLWWSERSAVADPDASAAKPMAAEPAPSLKPAREVPEAATPARKPQAPLPGAPAVDAFSAARSDLIANKLGLPSASSNMEVPVAQPEPQRPPASNQQPEPPPAPPPVVTAPPAAVAAKPVAVQEAPPIPAGAPEQAATAPPPPPAETAAVPASTPPLPLLFELPLATRKALPALKVTMLVYSEDPSRRFAIIDGKRVNQNGVMGNDLNLIEIQRDAMVLDFRGTRFLLPRLGR